MADDISLRVAAEIKGEMAKKGKDQGDIAEVLGISRQQISLRLRGKIPIRVDELEKIAKFLQVPASQFLAERAA
jgi:transcriptional regulator with XRE-family HTH domain